jgi:hypothetical protein
MNLTIYIDTTTQHYLFSLCPGASHGAEQVTTGAQRTLAHIRITQAMRQLADAERSLALAERATDQSEPLDTAA